MDLNSAGSIATISGTLLAFLSAVLFGAYKVSTWVWRTNQLLEKELTHNGGSSMKDSQARVEARLENIEGRLTKLETPTQTVVNVGQSPTVGGE